MVPNLLLYMQNQPVRPEIIILGGKDKGEGTDPCCLGDLKADGETIPGLEEVGGQSSNDCKQYYSQHNRHHNGHHIDASPTAYCQWICCFTIIR